MKEWFMSLEPRERRALIVAAITVTVLGLYAFGWHPMAKRADHLEKTVREQRSSLAWMEQAATEVRALRTSGKVRTATTSGQSLLATVDGTARRAGLGNAIRRVEPQGTTQVQIWLEQAPFDTLVSWLSSLQRQHGVTVSTLTAGQQDIPGTVNAHLTLEGGQ
jgi:general secretion pathway protein M